MSLRLRRISRYRPRVVTFLLFCTSAGILVLANLTDELRELEVPMPLSVPDVNCLFEVGEPSREFNLGLWGLSYGWPLLWHQYVIYAPSGPYINAEVIGWRYSGGRLAGAVALWLVLLLAPSASCEWMLRRYRPRLQWGLRTLLAGVGLVALFLGWLAWARDRADAEDALIDAITKHSGVISLKRWGPQWLDLIGADRYRRHIVAATLQASGGDDNQRAAIELLQKLSQCTWTPNTNRARGRALRWN